MKFTSQFLDKDTGEWITITDDTKVKYIEPLNQYFIYFENEDLVVIKANRVEYRKSRLTFYATFNKDDKKGAFVGSFDIAGIKEIVS